MSISGLKANITCAVCFDVFNKPTIISTCQHVFCKECIQAWFKQHEICPTCRKPFKAKALKISHRDVSLIDLYKNAKGQDKKRAIKELPAAKRTRTTDKTSFSKKLYKLNEISQEESHILYQILYNEPLDAGINQTKFKEEVIYRIARDLSKIDSYNEEERIFLYQLVLDLSQGDCSRIQLYHLRNCFIYQKEWVIPMDILQKARQIANDKQDAELLVCSFNHPEVTYDTVEKAAASFAFETESDAATFFLHILSLHFASEDVRVKAASKYFSFQYTDENNQVQLSLLLESPLSENLLTLCIKGCVTQALLNNAHSYKALCHWLQRSPQNCTSGKLKREVINRLIESLKMMDKQSAKYQWSAVMLFVDLPQLDQSNLTIGYLWEKYLRLLKKSQYDQSLFIPFFKAVSKYSAHELEFFHLMVDALADDRLPGERARLYIDRLLSYYLCAEFKNKLPKPFSTPQEFIINLIPTQDLRNYAHSVVNKW